LHNGGDQGTLIATPALASLSFDATLIGELRYHPVPPYAHRVAARDDILPLSRPATTNTGETINEVVITKGTLIVVSLAAYNGLEFLLCLYSIAYVPRVQQKYRALGRGKDAHEFNPDRWLGGVTSRKKPTSVGSTQTCECPFIISIIFFFKI
jgi:hypothetical protein